MAEYIYVLHMVVCYIWPVFLHTTGFGRQCTNIIFVIFHLASAGFRIRYIEMRADRMYSIQKQIRLQIPTLLWCFVTSNAKIFQLDLPMRSMEKRYWSIVTLSVSLLCKYKISLHGLHHFSFLLLVELKVCLILPSSIIIKKCNVLPQCFVVASDQCVTNFVTRFGHFIFTSGENCTHFTEKSAIFFSFH